METVQDNQKVTLELTVKQTNLILAALSERRYSEVYETIAAIVSQGQAQVQAKNED